MIPKCWICSENCNGKRSKTYCLLSENILQKMPYQPDSTSVHTIATEGFHAGQGVCQDHAHVLIAMCRALQLPARYVSGYLFDQNSPHLASHAWAEVFLDNQWYCFDVSNQLLHQCIIFILRLVETILMLRRLEV